MWRTKRIHGLTAGAIALAALSASGNAQAFKNATPCDNPPPAAFAGPDPPGGPASTFVTMNCIGSPHITTTSVSNSPYVGIFHPEIVPIFWQDSPTSTEWQTNLVSMGQAVGHILALTNSPYWAPLSQYGLSGGGMLARPRMAPMAPVFIGSAPGGSPSHTGTTANYTTFDISNIVYAEIDNHKVPPPLANDWVIYFVIIPGTVTVTPDSQRPCGFQGCNFIDQHNGVSFITAFTTTDQYFYQVVSHELTEAISWQSYVDNCMRANFGAELPGLAFPGINSSDRTEVDFSTQQTLQADQTLVFGSQPGALYAVQSYHSGSSTHLPYVTLRTPYTGPIPPGGGALAVPGAASVVPGGLTFGSGQTQHMQISDLCECQGYAQNYPHYTGAPNQVQPYWSAIDGACVVPERWGELMGSTGIYNGWGDYNHQAMQVYGGSGGILFSDEGYEVRFSQYPNWWDLGAATGSEYSVAGNWVVELPMDTSQAVPAFGLSQSQWFSASNNVGIITSVVQTSEGGGNTAVTDATGHVWTWQYNIGQWVNVSQTIPTVDLLVADGTDLLATAAYNRTDVWRYPGWQFGSNSNYWFHEGASPYPVVQLISSSDNYDVTQYYSVQAGGFGLFHTLDFGGFPTDLAMNFGIEYAFTQSVSGASFIESSLPPYQYVYGGEWYPSGSVSTGMGGGPVGRIVGGKYAWMTNCVNTETGGWPCVKY
jgi:hypothetical protein